MNPLLNFFHQKRLTFNRINKFEHEESQIIYMDATMTLSTNGEKIFLSSTWWGLVKNSYFTLEGLRGKSTKIQYGEALISEMKSFTPREPSIPYAYINRGNKVNIPELQQEESYITYLGKYYQLIYEETIRLRVIIRDRPNEDKTITVKISLPDGLKVFGDGLTKEAAANNAANQVLHKLGVEI